MQTSTSSKMLRILCTLSVAAVAYANGCSSPSNPCLAHKGVAANCTALQGDPAYKCACPPGRTGSTCNLQSACPANADRPTVNAVEQQLCACSKKNDYVGTLRWDSASNVFIGSASCCCRRW